MAVRIDSYFARSGPRWQWRYFILKDGEPLRRSDGKRITYNSEAAALAAVERLPK